MRHFPTIEQKSRWLLGIAGLLAVVMAGSFVFYQSRPERVFEQADAFIRHMSDRRATIPLDRRGKKRVISLLNRLCNYGDLKRISQLAPIFSASAFNSEDLQTVLNAVMPDMLWWNDEYPLWIQQIYHDPRLRGFYPHGTILDDTALPVAFRCAAGAELAKPPILAGNWNMKGERALLRGWSTTPMHRENGEWTLTIPLQPTHAHHFYHAVVRSAPWPRGVALGTAVFDVLHHRVNRVEIEAAPREPSRLQPETPSGRRVKIAVVGMDGLTFHTILPLVQADRLPHFSKLLQEGAWGRLDSIGGENNYASATCILTAMSGYLPARIGAPKVAFGFYNCHGVPRLWDLLSAAGWRLAVVGVTGSFPAEAIRGWLITDAYLFFRGMEMADVRQFMSSPFALALASNFGVTPQQINGLLSFSCGLGRYVNTTFPPELSQTADRVLAQSHVPQPPSLMNLDEFIFDRQVATLCSYFIEKTDIDSLIAYFVTSDAAYHCLGFDFEPVMFREPPYTTDPVRRKQAQRVLHEQAGQFVHYYQNLDAVIGYLSDHADVLILYSDHGMTSPLTTIAPAYLNPGRAIRYYERKTALSRPLPVEYELMDRGWIFRLPSQGLTDQQKREFQAFRQFLASLETVETQWNALVVGEIRQRSGALSFTAQNPLSLQRENLAFTSSLGPVAYDDLFEVSWISAVHCADGALIVRGPMFKKGPVLEDAYEADVAATALYAAGLPISADMDGRPWLSAFTDEFRKSHPVRYADASQKVAPFLITVARSIKWKSLIREVFH